MSLKTNKLYLPEIVGKGYGTFWNYKGRYRVVKGSRGSKKSKTAALWYIANIMKYPEANALVVRQVAATLKNSCFTELKWAIHRLQVDAFWKITESPLEMTYLPTGQKIYFRGLDDPLKVTSITVEVGVLCWLWVEEAYEILDEDDFNMLDESIRGVTPPGLFKQITITFNPWSSQHWLKSRFFDVKNDNILAMTTTYKCNEWLDAHDLQLFEEMKINRPNRYKVAGEGDWGITQGLIFENWSAADLSEQIPRFSNVYHGLDFGVDDPNAFVSFDVEIGQKKLYIFDEFYASHLTLDQLYTEVSKRLGKDFVTCDSAGAQNIMDLCARGMRAVPAIKGKGSILYGIQWLQGFDIVIDYSCKNTIREFGKYMWAKDKFGEPLNMPVDKDNHTIDALRYGCEPIQYLR